MNILSSLMTTFIKLARIIGLLSLAVGLAACSTVKLGYNNLDDIAYWWLDSYIDFSDDQATRVREDLRRLHRWHRTEELSRVGTLLQRMEELAPGEITAEQACAFVPQLRERLNVLTQRAEPAVVTLALGLAPEQLTHLQKKYERNNADFKKEWVLPVPELQEKRLKQFVERAEMIYGSLGEGQNAVLRAQLDRSIFEPSRMLGERQRRQQDMLATLRKVAGQPISISDARVLMRAYLERAQNPPDASARTYQEALIQEGCRNLASLHNSTSPAQRQTAVRRLRAYQRDVRELAAQS